MMTEKRSMMSPLLGCLSSTTTTLLSLILLLSLNFGMAKVNLLTRPEEAAEMTWQQLDEIFRLGTIDEGIPVGYSYGYAMLDSSRPVYQAVADVMWHGKRFEIVSGKNCPGENCGTKGVITNYLGAGPMKWQEMPGITYIGHLKDIKPYLQAIQLDEKYSVIVDYRNGGGDEIRLVNTNKRIYLGRGADWSADAQLFAYFVLQFFDTPQNIELNWIGPQHHELRNATYAAVGATEEDASAFIQAVPESTQTRLRRRRSSPTYLPALPLPDILPPLPFAFWTDRREGGGAEEGEGEGNEEGGGN